MGDGRLTLGAQAAGDSQTSSLAPAASVPTAASPLAEPWLERFRSCEQLQASSWAFQGPLGTSEAPSLDEEQVPWLPDVHLRGCWGGGPLLLPVNRPPGRHSQELV